MHGPAVRRQARRFERHDGRRKVASRVELLFEQGAEAERNAGIVEPQACTLDGGLHITEADVRPGGSFGSLVDQRVVERTEGGTEPCQHAGIAVAHAVQGTAPRYPERVTTVPRVNLFETFRCQDGIAVRGALHRARLERSAQALGIPYDEEEAARLLTDLPPGVQRGRLELTPAGTLTLDVTPFTPDPPDGLVRVAWASERIDATAPARRHKTRDRAVYDRASCAAQAAGLADVLFVNEVGDVAEGAISSLAIERDGEILTPPVDAGALPGVLRHTWLERGWAREERVTPDDVRTASRVWIGSSLRGARRVILIDVEVT